MKTRLALTMILTMLACVNAAADIDETAHWPVETTADFNAVYGTVSGIAAEDGDAVGMFNKDGDCFGAGLITKGVYHLSAFKREGVRLDETGQPIGGDFDIEGFDDGDEVVFKLYKKSSGQEYALAPSSGGSYTYQYQGRYPPININLAYNATDETGGGSDTPGDGTDTSADTGTTSAAISSGGIPGLLDKAEKKEDKAETSQYAAAEKNAPQKQGYAAHDSIQYSASQAGYGVQETSAASPLMTEGADKTGTVKQPEESVVPDEHKLSNTVKEEKAAETEKPAKMLNYLPLFILLIVAVVSAIITHFICRSL